MDTYELIKMCNNAYGTTSQRDTAIYEIRRAVSQGFFRTFDVEDVEVDGEAQQLLVANGINYTQKKIVALSSPLQLGSVVDCYNSKWLVTEVDAHQKIYVRGKMQRCNYDLRFINSKGKIDSRPCIIENYTKYNSGVNPDKTMTVPSSQYAVKLRLDEETIHFNRDRRFLIDINTEEPQAFVLTQPDRMSCVMDGKGYAILTVTQTERTNRDNVELMIADYFGNVVDKEPELQPMACRITYTGKPLLEIGKGYKLFRHEFYDSSGVLVQENPCWTVHASILELDQYLDTVICDEGIRIKATSPALLGYKVMINMSNEQGTATAELVLEVTLIG